MDTRLIRQEYIDECNTLLKLIMCLFEGDHTGKGGVATGVLTSNRLVSDGELTEVVAKHLRADINDVENLTVVDGNDGSNHFGDNQDVTEVSLDNGRLLTVGLSLLLLELSKELLVGLRKLARKLSTATRVEEGLELLSRHTEQLLSVNTTVAELLQRLPLTVLGVGHIVLSD